MTLDEWHAVLATEPATTNQVGAVMGEFERLGFGPRERAERLALTARLLGLDEVGSTRDLVQGDAGYLLRMLGGFRDRTELDAAIADLARRPSLLQRLARLIIGS